MGKNPGNPVQRKHIIRKGLHLSPSSKNYKFNKNSPSKKEFKLNGDIWLQNFLYDEWFDWVPLEEK